MEGITAILSRLPLAKQREKERAEAEAAQTRDELLQALRETSREMSAIQSCFDHETNFDMIESYIMQMDSLEKRYSYLIKRAKREHIAAF